MFLFPSITANSSDASQTNSVTPQTNRCVDLNSFKKLEGHQTATPTNALLDSAMAYIQKRSYEQK